MTAVWNDLRHAARLFRRSPGFTVAAIVTLALGIAANTTMFGFMNALLLKPFNLPELDRLVTVWERHAQVGAGNWSSHAGDRNRLSVADFRELSFAESPFESVAAYRNIQVVVTGDGAPERALGYLVTPGYFEALAIRAALGRTLVGRDGERDGSAGVVLSHGFWTRRFGGDPGIVGRTLLLDGRKTNIVGVIPAAINFPAGAPEFFGVLEFSDAELSDRTRLSVLVVGKLKPDASLKSAQTSLSSLAARLAKQYPETNAGRELTLVPLPQLMAGIAAPFLLLFEAAAMFVLLIACANVASLLLGRGVSRQREITLRTALGASRGRIVRQLLTEGLMLAVAGAGLAVILASFALDFVRAAVPTDFARWVGGWTQIRLEGRTLAFTLVVAVGATLVFALMPAIRSARVDLLEGLKAGGRGMSGPPRRRVRSVLVGAQVTLALVLLTGAELMTRGFLGLVDVYQGFDTEKVVTMRLDLSEAKYAPGPRVSGFYDRLLKGLATAPGIESAAVVSHLPADLGPIPRRSYSIEGQPVMRQQERPSADFQAVNAGYLPTLGIALLGGRNISDADSASSLPVAVVSESFARRGWGDADPIGRRIQIGDDLETWHTVVGVVRDVKQYWFDPQPRPTLYVSYLQSPRGQMNLLVRSNLSTAAVVETARSQVRLLDPDQPIDEIRTMATVVAESAAFIQLAASLMIALGVLALILAAVGVYASIADHVVNRTREIGVRVALGASGREIVKLIVGQAGRITAIGLALGLLGAWAAGRLMSAYLFGLVQLDFWNIVAVTTVLGMAAVAAAWLPARRAVRVDPLVALREE